MYGVDKSCICTSPIVPVDSCVCTVKIDFNACAINTSIELVKLLSFNIKLAYHYEFNWYRHKHFWLEFGVLVDEA